MFRRIVASVSVFALLASLVGSLPASAQSGTLAVTLDGDSPAGERPVSTQAELVKFTLHADGADVGVALFRMSILGDALDARQLYFFDEETNALIGSADGDATDLVFNGLLVPEGQSKTLVLKADMRGPSGSLRVAVDAVTVPNGIEVTGVPLEGSQVSFGASSTGPEPEVEPKEETMQDGTDGEDGANGTDPVVEREKAFFQEKDDELVERVKGRILLQVEERGEAWYVEPDREEKFYLRDGDAAYEALRRFGLGISNADLDKIPVGLEDRFEETDSDGDGLSDKLEEALGSDPNDPDTDGDGFDDASEAKDGFRPAGEGEYPIDAELSARLAGKIVLQVESRGEAWYINPVDNRRYYMTDGEAAYQIMRFLSLGVTNMDLRRIPVGE